MPLIRRLPKRGFRIYRRVHLETVNVERLNVFDEGSRVDARVLAERGIVKERSQGVKILGNGELKKKLEVVASAFSASARRKIEEAKGTAQLVNGTQKTADSR
jgi:large subunit ribosomal protein L15